MKAIPVETYLFKGKKKKGKSENYFYIADSENCWIFIQTEEGKGYGEIKDCDYTNPWIQPDVRKAIWKARDNHS